MNDSAEAFLIKPFAAGLVLFLFLISINWILAGIQKGGADNE